MHTNTHERDKNIVFIEEGHKYIINGETTNTYTSVTSFVKSQFPSFDPDFVIKRMKNSPKWPESKYFKMTDEEIKEMWNKSASVATTEGTGLHKNIELYLNGQLENEPDSDEWGYFKQFINNFNEEWYRSEWMIYDEDSRICGTLDFMAKNPDGTFTIIDWKRSKNISEPRSLFISNTSYWHYTLQLNLYKYILEKNYNMSISKLLIVQMHPETGLNVYKIPDYQTKLKQMIRTRRIKLHNKKILNEVKETLINNLIDNEQGVDSGV